MSEARPESSNSPASPDRRIQDDIIEPPTGFLTVLKQIGPGLIIAANIVGSGELIMTTKTARGSRRLFFQGGQSE